MTKEKYKFYTLIFKRRKNFFQVKVINLRDFKYVHTARDPKKDFSTLNSSSFLKRKIFEKFEFGACAKSINNS